MARARIEPDPVLRLLVRHQWLRDHGTPRLTTLVGDTRRSRHLWAWWLRLTGRRSTPEPLSVEAAIRRALATPTDPVAISLSDRTFTAWQSEANDRDRAFVAEGSIQLARRSPRRPGRRTTEGSRAIGSGLDGTARSLAELTLHDALEETPWTKGRFRLNQRLPFRFGGSDVEVDLLSREDRIAIEVDGVHHFTDRKGYRRDRSKDLLLQSHGYAVLRFLAEDVLRAPAEAIAAITRYMGQKLRREGAP